MAMYIQGIPYDLKCAICGKEVKAEKFKLDQYNYCCSQKCFDEVEG